MVAIVADTHMPKGRRELPPRCIELLGAAELIVHAGDHSGVELLERLQSLGPPLIAVRGNVEAPEVRARLPKRRQFDYAGYRVGVVHDAGPRQGRLRRLRGSFPDADAVIFGHSHLPLCERDGDGFQIFNPGSPTERRRAPHHTMGLLRTTSSGLAFELIEL